MTTRPVAMDSVEEAGLRAFPLEVHTDYPAGMPVSVVISGNIVPLVSIDAEWREEERCGFRARLADGSCWLLYYVPELELWSGIADAGHTGSEQR